MKLNTMIEMDNFLFEQGKKIAETTQNNSVQDELMHHKHIHQKGQDFWIELQDLEDNPGWNTERLNAMRREAARRMANADRNNESVRTK